MARIIVFGAAGKAGSRIVTEAFGRGHDVVAVAREASVLSRLPDGVRRATGDATSPASVSELAPGSDVVVVAVGGPDKSVYQRAAQAVVEALAALPSGAPRVIHMGGGGSLLKPDGSRFADTPGLPPTLVLEMKAQGEALAIYRASNGVCWTYISPPPGNFAPGSRTGNYRTGLDHPVIAEDGGVGFSYEDFAVAIVDEIERPQFIGKRFTVGY